MHSISRGVIIGGLALVVVLLTCSPLWQRVRADAPVISPWRPTVAVVVPIASGRVGSATDATPVAPAQSAPVVQVVSPSPAPLVDTTPQDSQLATTIDSYLNDLVNGQVFQGSVLVARGGQIILSKGYGFANNDLRTANTPQTRFRLASVTKQFTAAAIMILQARGQLDIHSSVCAYLDSCPPAWQPITVEHLLTHTSGLPNYTDFDTYEPTQAIPTTPEELIGRFRDLPLLFAPGSTYMYENSDYVLLGMIIERVSGMSYPDFVRSAIFAPLGMENSGFANAAPGVSDAVGYTLIGAQAPALDPSTLFSAGGLSSTVEDMYRWDQALYTTQLLPQPALDAMWTPHASNYGYGWRIDSAFGRRRIGHPGLIDGFQTMITRFPDDRVTVIVLCNLEGADVDSISYYISSLVFGT